MKYLIFLVLLGLTCFGVEAQIDTLFLKEIQIESIPLQQYASSRTVKVMKLSYTDQQLDQLLADQPSVFFKTYGNGQLSSISFRGSSASQTNVLWHGLPVNSPTLGQTDFSTWQTWLLDNVGIQSGGAGALYGSGAIGGTVFLDSFDAYTKQNEKLGIKIGQGSFGYFMSGIRSAFSSGRFSGQTKLMGSHLLNDFPYELRGTERKVLQNNAAVQNLGFKQTLQFDLNKGRLSADFLGSINNREIQPPTTNRTSTDQLRTRNFRAALEYMLDIEGATFTSTAGFFNDFFDYNRGQINESNQVSWQNRMDFYGKPSFSWQVGTLGSFSTARSENFINQNKQWQADLFLASSWIPAKSLTITSAIRGSFVDEIIAPIMPSVGFDWALGRILSIKTSYSRGFRYPTLNDRFWTPGGKRNLKPEVSNSVESGIEAESGSDVHNWSLELNGFYTCSKNWIVWIPGTDGIWSPQNVRDVHSRGLEGVFSYRTDLIGGELLSTVTSSYTRSTVAEDSFDAEQKGNQLPYTPIWLANFSNNYEKGNWSGFLRGSFTGSRFTTLDNRNSGVIDPYFLLDLGGGYDFMFRSVSCSIRASVQNLLDVYYENLINRAMPGINYKLELLISIK